MSSNDILIQVRDVLADVLDDDNIKITRETVASDVDGWDSLNHVRIMISIEKAFKIRLSASEIKRLSNVGDMVDLIASKGAA